MKKSSLSLPVILEIIFFIGVIIGIPFAVIQLRQQQELRSRATVVNWSANQTAVASCSENGAVINVTFTNTEADQDSNSMNVKATDKQSGKSVSMENIRGGVSKSGIIKTGRASLSDGTVEFALTWSDGRSGADTKTASYKSVEKCPSLTPTLSGGDKCPAGTTLLFDKQTDFSKGKSVNLGGTISSLEGSWSIEERSNSLLASGGSKISVTFTTDVLLNTVLIYDNDPKSSEKGWSINGVALPQTSDGEWGEPFKLNKKAASMVFDNGDDSPHFNVCARGEPIPSEIPTTTPTPKTTLTPSPTKTPTPKPSVSTTPTSCPTPGPIKNVRIECPNCPK